MEAMDLLDRHLEEGNFQEALSLTLTILKGSDQSSREAAWDRITRAGYSLSLQNTTVKSCPFLLGCLHAVAASQPKLIWEWQKSLDDNQVAVFLRQYDPGRDKPLLFPGPDLYGAHAALACAEAAISIKHNDYDSLFRHGSSASHWFNGALPESFPAEELAAIRAPSFLDDPIEACFSALSERLTIPVARARDLTRWFFSPAHHSESEQRKKIKVPFYSKKASVATLEVELRAGKGEFYVDPVAMAFVRWDDDFKKSSENAWAFVRRLACWKKDADVCWRVLADPPLKLLSGGSAGGAFFALLWHLLKDVLNDLSVAVSAGIKDDGSVLPVDHIIKKLDALLEVSDVSQVVVSKDQTEVEQKYGRLEIFKVPFAADPEAHGCGGKRQIAVE